MPGAAHPKDKTCRWQA